MKLKLEKNSFALLTYIYSFVGSRAEFRKDSLVMSANTVVFVLEHKQFHNIVYNYLLFFNIAMKRLVHIKL